MAYPIPPNTGMVPDPSGLPVGMAPDPSGLPVGMAPGPSGLPVGMAPGPSGLPVGMAPGPSGLPVGMAPGPSGLPVGMAPGPSGYPVGMAPDPSVIPTVMVPSTSGIPMGMAPGCVMPRPPAPSNCPPGLEYLILVDQLLVHQKTELVEALIGFETNNKYIIKNSLGQQVYFAAEVNDCCTRNCCSANRPFDMKILDNMGTEVIHLYRPLRCDCCLFPWCLQKLVVEAPPGSIVGYVRQNCHIVYPRFTLQNEHKEPLFKMRGPLFQCSCIKDVKFKIKTVPGKQIVGMISKQWSGLVKEMLTDADNFSVTFPYDLDVKMKAVFLGAVFLIDFMYFEDSPDEQGIENKTNIDVSNIV